MLPPRFVERLREIVPAERIDGVLAALAAPRAATFWINPRRATDEQVLAELAAIDVAAERIEGMPHAAAAPPAARAALVRSAAFAEGRLYVQSLSSLLAAPALDPQPGERVLDLAAAPGGKMLHLAAHMGDRGDLRAVESSRPRFFRLRETLRRFGVACARCYHQDGRAVGRLCPALFDRVLLDAPCSGEAQLRAEVTHEPADGAAAEAPNWSPRKIAQCAGKQRQLLSAAIEACRPGGVVLYCTCTFAPEENEAVIADALERHGARLAVEPIELPAAARDAATPALHRWRGRAFPPETSAAVRILPDARFDAFFLCRLRRR